MVHGYQQYCGLARALDLVGDRWTLLIVRELVPGPRRFTDLIEGLPGISRNLLTERLRTLEADGIVSREQLAPPAARQVYELTGDGRDLAQAMGGLIAWGARRLGPRGPSEAHQARWAAVGLTALADREAFEGITERYQYVVGDTAFYIAVDDGSVQLFDGWAEDPAVVLKTDDQTWADLAGGRISGSAARAAGAMSISGAPQAVKRQRAILSRSRLNEHASAAIGR